MVRCLVFAGLAHIEVGIVEATFFFFHQVIEKSATGWWFVKTPCGDVGWAPAPYITKKSVVVPHKKENKVIFSDKYSTSNMAGSKERVTLHTDPAKQNKV